MARKQSEDPFNTTALAPYRSSSTTPHVSIERSHSLTKAERRSIQEYRKQLLVMEEQEDKAQKAQQSLGRLRETGVTAFSETTEHIWAVRSSPGRDPVVQHYVDRFAEQSIQDAGSFIQAATRYGSQAILDEVGRSLYFETEEERRGWLRRTFGGGE